MAAHGAVTLADIARALNTTPQAVSNWKARDQIPFHIVAKINNKFEIENKSSQKDKQSSVPPIVTQRQSANIFGDDGVSLSDILLTLAEQLKIIMLIPVIFGFATFTYVQFIQKPLYKSTSTILLPESKNPMNGLSGIASQFGVGVSQGVEKNLSNPSLFPELIKSRTFAERIFEKSLYTNRYGKKLTLLAILTDGNDAPTVGLDTLIQQSMGAFQRMVSFANNESFSLLTVEASEPVFAKDLNKIVLEELQELNRYFRTQHVNEKISFIESRVASVEDDLIRSEKTLQSFREQNRQISSPSLQLEEERLTRGVEIQKGIFLTLKQQLELAKIEEVQKSSIVQVLDAPQVPLNPSNKRLVMNVLLAILSGLGIGVMFGFVRSYYHNKDIDERKKLRRVRNFIKKKSKDVIMDRRFLSIIIGMQIIGIPFYFSHQSKYPIFFGMYSYKLMIINTLYIFILILFILQFIRLKPKSINE
ncbi:hypothetical protein HOD02_03655 [bacterium]|nr:hypothetical protein [bacterium]